MDGQATSIVAHIRPPAIHFPTWMDGGSALWTYQYLRTDETDIVPRFIYG